jgi:hypothetical protein
VTDAIDPLDRYWALFDMLEPVICAQETAWWPEGALQSLVSLGLLIPTSSAAQVSCTLCADRHVEEVQSVRRPDGTVRHYIACPENMRVQVDAEQLRQWAPDFKLLARGVKELLNIDGRARDRVAERVWRLGSTTWNKQPREVFLARGLGWSDGETIAKEIPTDDRPIVFAGMSMLPPTVWSGIPPAVVPLGTVLHSRDGQLRLDLYLLAQLVGGADETAAFLGNLADRDLKRRVQRYAEQRISEGGTTELIAACVREGMSTHEAEADLKNRGVRIDHSTIARKIKNVVKAASPPSSPSVLRHPSSQPRDRKRRPIRDAQPKKE